MQTKPTKTDSFPARLRLVRQELAMDYDILADLSRCNSDTIAYIESGIIPFPRQIYSIAKALDVNPAWLIFGEPYAYRKAPVNQTTTNTTITKQRDNSARAKQNY